MTTDERIIDAPLDVETVGLRADRGHPVDLGRTAKRAALGFIVVCSTLLLLGALGSLFLFDGSVADADADVVGWVVDNRTPVLDSVFTIGSTLSDTWTVIGVVVGSATMLWVTGHQRPAVTVVLGVTIELGTFLVVGTVIGRPRPDFEPLHSLPSTASFPSGHVAAAFVLYGSLALATRTVTGRADRRWIWAVPFSFATVVAASRVYEGVHHPLDVIAGLVLGILALAAAGWSTGLVALPTDQPTEGAS